MLNALTDAGVGVEACYSLGIVTETWLPSITGRRVATRSTAVT